MNVKRSDLIAIICFSVLLTLVGAQSVFSFTGSTNTLSPGALEITSINASYYYLNDVLVNERLEGDYGSYPMPADYVISYNGSHYLANTYNSTANVNTDAEDIIEWVWSQTDCSAFYTAGVGNWTLDDTVNSQRADVTWISTWGLTFSAEAGEFDDENVISITHDRVTLIGLKLYGHMGSQPDHPGVWPGGPWNTQRGIYGQCDDLTVIRPYIFNMTQYGLYWGNGRNALVQGGIFKMNAWNGVEFGTGATLGKIVDCHAENHSDVGFALYGNDNTIIDSTASGQALSIGSTNYAWGAGIEGRDNNKVIGFTGYDLDIGIGVGADPVYSPENWLITDFILYDIDLICIQIGYGPGTLSNGRYSVTVNGIVIESYADDIDINDVTGYGESGDTLIKIDSQDNIKIDNFHARGAFTYGLEAVGTCSYLTLQNSHFDDTGNVAFQASGTDNFDHLRIINTYFGTTTGIAGIDDGDHIQLLICRFDCTNPIDMDNANVSEAHWQGNDWNDSTNDPTVGNMSNLRRRDNIDKNGAWWTDN